MADTTEDKEIFVWQSNNGCDLCETLDGMEFEIEPDRPHKNCQCTIYSIHKGDGVCKQELEYEIMHTGNNHTASAPIQDTDTFDATFDYQIKCEDGSILEGEVTIQVEYGLTRSAFRGEISDDMMWDLMANDVLEVVENIAMMNCPACSQPLLV